ncbi:MULTISPECIES: hypothetical protein [Roseobacteraceae]|jgi:hypothetical protein|uniref:Uncharacterized protein n=1 Tax=Celeribacter baekdonensis B30 TaxID=1208323 RepID=K2JB34_9RHOB|nr:MULTISPECIES: hypothetical protein [Roseobacteraceae]EKE72017.1 hypothetical protein B30_09613 [Celeribacter baekdonensis B30]KAB6717330.1 hypothetical protein C8029_04490 [Roseobacter sp. TSBP12]|tara:strand:+ start:465 stop:650 length:186 start_codon:yes stop_codon:yes gene_type:complete
MSTLKSEPETPKRAAKAVPAPTASPEKQAQTPVRHSIFDESYAPVGAELRKAWTRFNPKRK